jgi:hypothetical protein
LHVSFPFRFSTGTHTPSQGTGATTKVASVNNPKASIKTTKKVHELRSADWRVRPGYSSGASSFSDSDENETTEDVDFAKDRSRHSDILALSRLREEMVADGDLAKTVVRIEVCLWRQME